MENWSRTRRLRAAALCLAATINPASSRAANNIDEYLRDHYAGKTFVLRNFYSGERLTFDSAGMSTSSHASGDWTVDGFVHIKSLRMSGQRLTLQAERLSMGNCGEGCGFLPWINKENKKKEEKENRLRIEVTLDTGDITASKADAALARIFLTTQDHLVDLVPDYWKPCVLAASGGKGRKQYLYCRFQNRLDATPGVASTLEQVGETKLSGDAIVKIGNGVSPPKVISQTFPSFTDEARHAKYQGTVVLSFIVNTAGHVSNIRIQRPLGIGLDRKAAENAATWQFEPAIKNGQPVAVEMTVETNFNLY